MLSPNRMKDQGKTVQESLEKYKAAQVVEFLEFHGECTWEEFNRIHQKIDTLHITNSYCLIGVGGGTNIDCVRAIAYLRNVSFISVPTLASNDAPVRKMTMIICIIITIIDIVLRSICLLYSTRRIPRICE
ncbi:hypothetical protein DND47_30785 [Pseudomonas syringae pv. syringae]|nr:hypothetical protein DND47_30785 [Pseudomonas syringae pv. syringae]